MTFAASVNDNRVSLDNDNVSRVVDTCCLGCVFAQGKFTEVEKKLHFTQSRHGCDMDVLSKMQTQGQELQECTDNDGSEFYVIRGRVCPFHRTPSWCGWSQDTNKAVSQVRQEVQLKPDVVIYLDNSMEPHGVIETIEALNQGNIRPARVYIANNSDLRPSQIMKLMSDCPLRWSAETMINKEPLPRARALDITTAKCTNIFVTYFMAGYKPPLDFFAPIDTALYDNLDRFVVLEPLVDTINCMTVMRQFYKQAGGMTLSDGITESHIVAKAKRISEDQKCQYLVRPVTQIVTQLSQ